MSANRKWLKIVSFIQFIVAIAVLILAGLAAAGVSDPGAGASVAKIVLLWLDKILFAVLGFLSIADAVMGVHGANRPSALGSHRLVAILTVLVGIVSCPVSFDGHGIPVTPVIAVVVALIAAILDTKVRKELDK